MPWKASSVMEERLRFVARLLDGETMTDVCRDFGISRKTGYKIFDRYKEHGLEALSDRSRRPRCPAARTARRGDEAVAKGTPLSERMASGRPRSRKRTLFDSMQVSGLST